MPRDRRPSSSGCLHGELRVHGHRRSVGEPIGHPDASTGAYKGDAGGPRGREPHFPGTVRVRKSHTESPVHRAGRIDEILVCLPEIPRIHKTACDSVHARHVHVPGRHPRLPATCPFSARVLGQHPAKTRLRASPGRFRYKGIANVFDSLPTEFLFTATRAAIAEMVDLVFESEQQQEVGHHVPHEPASDSAILPGGHAQGAVRRRAEARALEAQIGQHAQATYSDHGLFVGRYDTVLLHYYLTGVEHPGDEAIEELTERIRQLATPWLARLWTRAGRALRRGPPIASPTPTDAPFPRSGCAPPRVERSGARHRACSRRWPVQANLVTADVFREDDDFVLRLYQASGMSTSPTSCPCWTNFGLVVIDSLRHRGRGSTRGGELYLDTFRLELRADASRPLLEPGAAAWSTPSRPSSTGEVTDDNLNGLVLSAGLTWERGGRHPCAATYALQPPARHQAVGRPA